MPSPLKNLESYSFTIPGICTVTMTIDRTSGTINATAEPQFTPPTPPSVEKEKKGLLPWWAILLLGVMASKRIADLTYLLVIGLVFLAAVLLFKDKLEIPNLRKMALKVLDQMRLYLGD